MTMPADLAATLLQANPADLPALLGLDRASRTRRRNAALGRAAELLSGDGCGAWITAGRLAAAIERFERALWPALLGGARLELSEIEQALYEAFLTGATPVTCQRRLFELLRAD
ncbi:MAG: hypothetical protein J0I00_01000 [Burkholderiales bacterium]|nr:hypothetical protein [Burkholderiales bacterium]MBS0403156.1 hypothetical protein [Pseudomonadota bacterium]MBS0413986.1 hypothetical protein [Pseudomonadota bacterium]